jgi:uncharacterized protein (DUF2336 family)
LGLTAHDMSDMSRVAQLAANPKGGVSREEIYLAVASLYRLQGAGLNGRERDLMREILRRLTRDVEMAIRIALARRLSDDTDAPHDLILLLVDDTIEVARPLILHSPLLTESDALRLVAEGSLPHLEAVAGRLDIGVAVTDALASCNAQSVLVTLLRNASAKISETAYGLLVEKSRALAALQEPLIRRPDLPADLANKMRAWVPDALKVRIDNNDPPAPKDDAFSQAANLLPHEPARLPGPPSDSDHKLIEKLAASGQLRAGFLMRVLGQGQIDLFDLAFARLLDADHIAFRKFFYQDGVKPVAMSCRAAGIDKSVFATVFNLSRQARNRKVHLGRQEMAEADAVFTGLTRPAAMDAVRQAILFGPIWA